MMWARTFPNSANNFDLTLPDPKALNAGQMKALLGFIEEECHRGLTLSSRACQEFRRWFDQPDTPLKSEAYVLLSNWFMTQSGDRHSTVASRCEDLWDSLFPCRPIDRLSSPMPGRNHLMLPAEFDSFWRRVLKAQGECVDVDRPSTASTVEAPTAILHPVADDSTKGKLSAKFERKGLHCEVEGSPSAIAEFLALVSNSELGKA
jgi:hypothetical protein